MCHTSSFAPSRRPSRRHQMDECLPTKSVHASFLRKSAYARTNLYLHTCPLQEIRCSASKSTRCAAASVFHKHKTSDLSAAADSVCWHCCYEFDTLAFRVPRVYDPSEDEYHVLGWFCSANCAKAFILEHSTFDRGYQMSIFVRMLREVYGITDPVIEAPPRIALEKFGGPFNIDDFRTQTNICTTMTPPFISHSMLIEERPPIAAIGEVSIPQRGTVRGLRRPAANRVVEVGGSHVCDAPLDGAYDSFLLAERGERMETTTGEAGDIDSTKASGGCKKVRAASSSSTTSTAAAAAAAAEAPKKKQRTRPAAPVRGGLARFME